MDINSTLSWVIQLAKDNGAILGTIGTMVGGVIGYSLGYVRERRKENKARAVAMRRLCSQLLRIEQHCRISVAEFQNVDKADTVNAILQLSKMTLSDFGFLRIGDDDWEFYSEDLSNVILTLAVLIRNNDLHIRQLLHFVRDWNEEQRAEAARAAFALRDRMEAIANACSRVRRDIQLGRWKVSTGSGMSGEFGLHTLREYGVRSEI